MKRALLAGVAGALLLTIPIAARAADVLHFGQTSETNTVTFTPNGLGTQTLIDAVDVSITNTQLFGSPPGVTSALFTLHAFSVDSAVPQGTGLTQHYSGIFSIISGLTNVLSGSFTDLAFGVNASFGLVSSDPPDLITFTSDVIPTGTFTTPTAVNFNLTNVTPGVSIFNETLGAGTASIGGSFSATQVPEPMGILAFGLGIVGLATVRIARRIV